MSALAGCGGQASRPARPADPLAAMNVRDAKGEVTYCVSEDDESEREAVAAFHTTQRTVKARYKAYDPSDYDTLYADVQGGRCDVLNVDDADVAGFADAGAATDLTPYADARRREFFPGALEAVRYRGRTWAMPRHFFVQLLYSRLTDTTPSTWQDAFAEPRSVLVPNDDYGATAAFLQLAYAAGGRVLSEDGLSSALDAPENLRALELLQAGGLLEGDALENAEAFEKRDTGRFMINWNLRFEAGNLAASAPPPFAERRRVSVLSGAALVIPTTTANRDAAVALLDFLTSDPAYADLARDHGYAPPTRAAWASIDGQIPNGEAVKAALEIARPFPPSPQPGLISETIAKAVYDTVSGRAAPAEALKTASAEIDAALEDTAPPGDVS
ncbi:extracellular solute-binding protein [Solirubrobacter phytolaccae]|uniref:Extracellular solute-binding protein n=1 Tax=Solirubrobacter phytolaccae TaxID=1404360 RepID=A0A9X3N930_9ACTN|nr:extracellular solute-binding protein [Solirubrobacter phytolaccae]MDA0180660.1 extracellular solute-binding protein [Solirubrobacter phytolaccae]